jgi:hypothetical protein
MKKAIVIIIFLNWMLSVCGLSIDIEKSPLWAVISVVIYFGVSSHLLKYADKLINKISTSRK